jgi:putative ABC transport system ATP-binding protein
MPETLKNLAVVCRSVRKTFGKGPTAVEALKGIDLEVERGQLRMLMGPSGSGKTTLISIIAGILTQDSGNCLIHGVDLNHLSDKERTAYRGKNIGFVFQLFRLIPMLTTEENISIPLIINGLDRKTAIKKACELLDELSLSEKIGAYPSQLSGGQQQRIAIARALIHNPKLLVCDEPTSFLDQETGLKIMQLLQDLIKKKGLTILVVTHDPRITPFAHHIDYLEDGKIYRNN